MRLTLIGLAAISVLTAESALAVPARLALPPATDLSGAGSGSALVKAVRKAMTEARVSLVPAAERARVAKAAKIKFKPQIKAAQAGRLAARGGFAGVVVFRKGRSGAFAQLVDAKGQVTLERLLRVNAAAVPETDAKAFATAVAESLGGEPPPTPPSFAPAPTPPVPEAVVPVAPPAPPATAESSETASALEGPEALPARSTEPAAGFFFRGGLFGGGTERRFFTPNFSYTTGYPYLQGGLSLEIFPFRNVALGLVGDFSVGQAKDQVVGGTGTFTSTDLRADAAFAYRLRVCSGPFCPFLIPKLGFGLRDFDAPSSANLTGAHRLFLVGGLAITQPLVPRYLRLSAGLAALPLSKLQGSAQTDYGASSSFGLEWTAELGGDVIAGLEWALQLDQERFMDSYSGPPTSSGVEIYTGYTLQLRYRL